MISNDFSDEEIQHHDTLVENIVDVKNNEFWNSLFEDRYDEDMSSAVFSVNVVFGRWKDYLDTVEGLYNCVFFQEYVYKQQFLKELAHYVEHYPVVLHSSGLYFAVYDPKGKHTPEINHELNKEILALVNDRIS